MSRQAHHGVGVIELLDQRGNNHLIRQRSTHPQRPCPDDWGRVMPALKEPLGRDRASRRRHRQHQPEHQGSKRMPNQKWTLPIRGSSPNSDAADDNRRRRFGQRQSAGVLHWPWSGKLAHLENLHGLVASGHEGTERSHLGFFRTNSLSAAIETAVPDTPRWASPGIAESSVRPGSEIGVILRSRVVRFLSTASCLSPSSVKFRHWVR